MKIHTDTRGTRSRRGDRCTALLCNGTPAVHARARKPQRAALVAGQNKKNAKRPQPARPPPARPTQDAQERTARKKTTLQSGVRFCILAQDARRRNLHCVQSTTSLPMCVRDERVCLSRVPSSRLPYVRTLSLERDALRAVVRPLLERAADCPNADTAAQRRGRHRPRSVHSFRPPMPAMKTAKSHCSGSSGMRTWLGSSLGLGLGLGLGIGIGSRDRVRARVGLGVGIGLRGRERVQAHR